MDEAYQRGGFDAPALGCLGSAAFYSAANWYLTTRGAKHRKRSGSQQPSEGSRGTASTVAVTAVFLPALPEGLSSAIGIRKAGRSAIYIVGVWGRDHGRQRHRCLLNYALVLTKLNE